MTTFRHFYVKSTKGVTDAKKINLKDIPGTSGRLDIIARSINAAFWLSNNIRRNVVFHTILHGMPDPPVYMRFEGEKMRKISPDERSIILFILKALEKTRENEVESTPGVFVSRKNFEKFIEENRDKRIYLLMEDGKPMDDINFKNGRDYLFILGDNLDLSEEEKQIAIEAGATPVSIGKTSYLTSHCIVVINWYLDMLEREVE